MNRYRKNIKQKLLLLFILYAFSGYSQQLEFMGYPIHSPIRDFSNVLTAHGFKDRYTSGDLAHQCWDGGDFWKQKNCNVRLFAQDNVHVDLIEVTISPTNFKTPDEYTNTVAELVSDLSNKYGQCAFETLDVEQEKDIFFHPPHLKEEDVFYVMTWSCNNGELKVGVCSNRVYAVLIKYKSVEYINRNKEAVRFKGQGASDL